MRELARTDKSYRNLLWKMCEEDFLFWAATFAFCFEPRPRFTPDGKKLPKVVPFIPWDHQVPVIREIEKNLGVKDIGIEKSRGEGASWIGVLFAMHNWIFLDETTIGLVSKDEATGDTPGDKSSLFGKLEFLLEILPRWMVGDSKKDWVRHIPNHTLRNLRNGAIITSYAATGDVASGGRTTWFFMDELAKVNPPKDADAMASTEPVTDSRLIISTPRGSSGAYYDIMHEDSGMVKLTLAWEENPTRNRGLYRMKGGRPVAVDPVNNPLHPDYNPPTKEVQDRFARLQRKGFNLNKSVRSPWFDERCDRPKMTPQFIAQEYERDYGGSSFRVFGDEFQAIVDDTARTPLVRGVIHYHGETLAPDFERREDGPIKLWVPLRENGIPPAGDYVVGVDVSSGMGGSYTSNSVITILDMGSKQQVLEYATNTVEPADFADECIALCHLFHGAYLAWEDMGPGVSFKKQVLNRGYSHIYKRTVSHGKGRKKTKEYGVFHNNTDLRRAFFSEMNVAVRQNGWQIRSDELKEEFKQYILVDGEKIVHQQGRSNEDDSTKGRAHGDRVMALGVAFQAVKDRPDSGPAPAKNTPAGDPPVGSLGWRMRQGQDGQRRGDGIWDDRSTSQVVSGV